LSGVRRRLERLEENARPAASPGDEHEHRERRERIAYEANRANERRSSEGREPVFKVDEGGDVFCVHDGKPVTDFHQTLAEEWYWGFREWEANPRGFIHDEATHGYYMPDSPHELAFSRNRCYLPRFFWALGDGRADPYCIRVPERLDVRTRGEG
jgi:hypothetical protein